jgi:hypothetical protein
MKRFQKLFHRCRNFDFKENSIRCQDCEFTIFPTQNKFRTGYIWRIPSKFTEDQQYQIIALLYENSPNGHIEIILED